MAKGQQVASTYSIPAPTGGLNARDAISNMKETDAVIMTNFFPTPSDVELRNGSLNWKTGFTGWVETLAFYSGPITKKLFAWNGTKIYDASAAGTVGAAVVSGLTSARSQFINIGTAGGHFLLTVNGADKLQGYDGTNWWVDGDGAHDITGVDTANIINIALFKRRAWLIEKNTFHAWYLPVDSIAGAASDFDLSALFKLGGFLMTMATWTIDNAAGIDDYAAFISSEGEIALYKGDDPTDAATWALVGMFRIGRPIGRRCAIKVGSDVVVICADGAFPLSKALLTDRSQIQDSITNKIINLINADVQAYSANFGWQPILYPIGNKLVINVPEAENNTQYQYVMNTINGSWCKFTGWNAACFEFFNDGLYYGGNGAVVQCDTGSSDNGSDILGDCLPAFSYFKSKGQQKQFTMARPIFSAPGQIFAAVEMNTDFEQRLPQSTPTFEGSTGSPWDTSPWDTSPWGFGTQITKHWQTVNGLGYAGSLRVNVAANDISVRWQSTDFMYQIGGVF